jgi:putative transposase
MRKISYKGYWFPAEIIQRAIWLYLRFTLSFRDVEDLLAERGAALLARAILVFEGVLLCDISGSFWW